MSAPSLPAISQKCAQAQMKQPGKTNKSKLEMGMWVTIVLSTFLHIWPYSPNKPGGLCLHARFPGSTPVLNW